MITLFETETHKNIMFDDFSSEAMVQANQHLIMDGKEDGKEGMILDPGGHKVYAKLFPEISSFLPINKLKYMFFSHQDPDIIAAMNGWLMVTDSKAFLPEVWMRFVTHFGVDELVLNRITAIPESGMTLPLNDTTIYLIPAHFIHSCGNFQVYDSVSKILYTGDLGASLGNDYTIVEDFDSHIQYMEGFHTRYMPTSRVLKMWVNMTRKLDIDIIAPQHGAIFKGKEMVEKFINWIDQLNGWIDMAGDSFNIPG